MPRPRIFHSTASRFAARARRSRRCLSVESLEARHLLAGLPIISEFLSSNDDSLVDEDNQASDWIELTNAGDEPIDLAGWHLTDNPENLNKWTFPSTILDPGEYLIVFASGKDRATSGQELHTDFQLDAAGEYLALVSPDETMIASEFGSAATLFPRQISDVSYGVRDTGAAGTTLVGPASPASYRVPTDGSLGASWTAADFDDAGWSSGPGPLGFADAEAPAAAPPLTEYAWSVLRDNPAFYWNFDEASGPAADLVRGQANDRLVPSTGAGRIGHSAIGSNLNLGQAATFDGNDVFIATALGDGQMPGAWAIEFWVQATGGQITPAGSSGFRNDYLFSFGGDGTVAGDNPGVPFDQSAAGADNKIELFRANRTGANGPALNDNDWHHVVLAFYGNGTSIGVANRTDVAIDGVVSANIADGNFSSAMTLNQAFLVGAKFASGAFGFEGRIDEVALYDLSGMATGQVTAKVTAIAAHHALASTAAAESPLQGIRPVSYAYNVAPGGSANYADSGLTKLNDGAFGSTVANNFGTGHWAGWQTADPVITFDLGEAYDLSAVTIDYSVAHPSGVHAPDSVAIAFSSDGVNFGAPTNFSAFNDFAGPAGLGWSRRAVASVSAAGARFARLTFANSDEWTFLGEVQFVGSQPGEPGHGFEPPAGPAAEPVALLGYWDFNDRTTDLSGNGSDATLQGATYSPDTPAVLGGGKSIQLNAVDGDYAEVAEAAHLRLGEAFTISTWMRSTNLNQGPNYLISRNTSYANPYGSPSKQYALIYEYVDHRVEFFGPSRLSGDDPRPGSQLPVADTAWHHVAYTSDGATLSGFVDGVGVFTIPRPFTLDDTFASSWFFGTANPDVGFFSGFLDDVAMWNGALSPAQITALAAGASPRGVAGFGGLIETDVAGPMHGENASILTRREFTLAEPATVETLLLRMQYDDGFVAYLNGTKVAEASAPAAPAWNSSATSARPDGDAAETVEFDISAHRGALVAGRNVLAIHGLNVSADDNDFLLSAELISFGDFAVSAQASFFTTLTPGGPNGPGLGEPGPAIEQVSQPAGALGDGADLVVTANVSAVLAPTASVLLDYRVDYGATVSLAMRDDGLGGDLIAADGQFTAVIPASASSPGQMVRYKVRAVDEAGRGSRYPLFLDPLNSPEYLGTVIADPSVTSELPIFQFFIVPGTEGAADTRGGTRASVFYGNEFYENVEIRLRGRSINSTGKLAYKFDFNQHHHFLYDPAQPRVEELDLGSTGLDKSYMRPLLGFEFFRDAGSEYSVAFPMRVERNGDFFSVGWFIENPDEDYLLRNGLDPEGAFYKGNLNGFTTAAQPGYRSVQEGFDKKTREWEDNTDIVEFTAGVELSGQALVNFLFDNVDIARQINYMAAEALVQDADRLVNNFYAYRDSNDTGLWHMIVWDLDLSLGQFQVASDVLHADDDYPAGVSHPFHGIQTKPDFRNPALWNNLLTKLIAVPATREMFLRRLRTLMDEFLKPAGTPAEDLYFERRIDELFAQMTADVALDKAKWGNRYGAAETFMQSLNRLKQEYFAVRRTHLFQTHTAAGPSGVTTVLPSSAPAKAFVPTGDIGLAWTQRTAFDDDAWLAGTTGIGYDEDATYLSRLGLDLRSEDYPEELRIDRDGDGTNENDSVYIRVPFSVDDPAALTQLRLRMQYDDAFIAYINGVEVARANIIGAPAWNSAAPGIHDDTAAMQFVDFDISTFGGPGGILVAGENVLAIHGLNDATNGAGSSSDMLFLPEIINGNPAASDSAGIPSAQAGNPSIQFGEIDFNPASGNQDEEYIALVNPNAAAVDISGWTLSGAVSHTFTPGTVIPAGATLYVAADFNAFRARTTGPRGGQGLFVQGSYNGHISNFGELIELAAADGSPIASVTTPFVPSDAQKFLRVTEVMYHPADASAAEIAAGFVDQDDFEYVELVNTSSGATAVTLDLAGVRFSAGLDFAFADGAITALAPGERVLVVRSAAAMALRYGDGLPIAGEFANATGLSNSGETMRLDDAEGSTIQDFFFDDNGPLWHPTTDGEGFSLVIADPLGPLDSWSDGAAWRPSAAIGGSPGEAENTLLQGDINGDLRVDLLDLAILQANLGTASGAEPSQGDVNGDGAVSRADAALVARNYGKTPPAAASSAAAVFAQARTMVAQAASRRAMARRPAMRSAALAATAVDSILTATRRFDRGTRGVSANGR